MSMNIPILPLGLRKKSENSDAFKRFICLTHYLFLNSSLSYNSLNI
jgi:hypothetical protein